MATLSLIDRLGKRAAEDRRCAENSAIVADLLEPQMAAFEARTGHNVYAVRMAVDHRNSVKRDNGYADDLEAAIRVLASAELAVSMIGNVDHSKGGGENAARLYGQMLNDIRDTLSAAITRATLPDGEN